MQDQLRIVNGLLANNEVKKAEITLARYLRSSLPGRHEHGEALALRSRIRLRSARPDDALADLHAAKDLQPLILEKPEMLELMADCYLARYELASVGFADRQDTNKANEIFHQLLATYPEYPNRGWVYYQLGRVALLGNDIEGAEKHFLDALLNPSSVRALTAYCFERLGFIAAYEKRQLDFALGLLDKAIYTYPAAAASGWIAQVYVLRSRVLREDRRYAEAVGAAEAAIQIAMGNSEDEGILLDALLTVAELLSRFEQRERDTIAYLQQFMQISKNPPGIDVTWSRVHEMLGDSYSRLAQYTEAAEAYEAALRYNPDHPWEDSLQFRIARCYYLNNNYSAAISAIEQLINARNGDGEHIQDYHVYDVLGNAQFATGRYADAMKSYQIALDLAPANTEEVEKIKKYYQFAQEMA